MFLHKYSFITKAMSLLPDSAPALDLFLECEKVAMG